MVCLFIQKLLISCIQEKLERLVPAHQKHLKFKDKTEKELKRYLMCVGGGRGVLGVMSAATVQHSFMCTGL